MFGAGNDFNEPFGHFDFETVRQRGDVAARGGLDHGSCDRRIGVADADSAKSHTTIDEASTVGGPEAASFGAIIMRRHGGIERSRAVQGVGAPTPGRTAAWNHLRGA